ncbi:unknown [Clostridium sp. CAG:470]|nr:MAG: hypothetical protein BHW03_04800 [Clostridium sp. 28_17]CDE14023.1 unknown [Clostridium sp. CAG:470]
MTSKQKKQKNNFDVISQFMNSDMKEKKLEKTIHEIFVLDRQIYERDLNIGLFYENGKKFNRTMQTDYAKYGNKPIPILLIKK